MEKDKVLHYMKSDLHRFTFLKEHALVDLSNKENLIGLSEDVSNYFYSLIEVVCCEVNKNEPYAVIKFDNKFYRMSGYRTIINVYWTDWNEVKLTGVKLVHFWDDIS